MNKLGGMPGQNLPRPAETSLSRGSLRPGKDHHDRAIDRASFHDLLHSVSRLSKQTLQEEGEKAEATQAASQGDMQQNANRDVGKTAESGCPEMIAQEPLDAAASRAPEEVGPTGRLIFPSVSGKVSHEAPMTKSFRSSNDSRDTISWRTMGFSRPSEVPVSGSTVVDASTAMTPQVTALTLPQAPAGSANGAAGSKTGAAFDAVAANIELASRISTRDTSMDTPKASIIGQETHLPPLAPFSAPQQIANAIISDLKATDAAPSASPSPLQDNAPEQPLKILTISLDPPALGNVTVRLRLAGPDVSIRMSAERLETCQMLDQQRDSMRELMHSAGYVADIASVQHGALDGFPASSTQLESSLSGQSQSSHPQAALGGWGPSAGQSQGSAKRTRDEREPVREASHEQNMALRHDHGVVYL